MKKALLVVSFGTSYPDTCEKNIVACERELAASCPDRDTFRAFTSGMIIRKLKQRDGIEIDTPLQALQKLAEQGYQDVANIKEDIVQRVCTRPYFGGAFTILKPVVWAMQQDDTHPYYFGACTLTCTAPAMTQDTELEGLV